jgi:hypothetical protein
MGLTAGGLGFTILNQTGVIAAQYAVVSGVMAMSTGWTYTNGVGADTPLSNQDTVLIDMGSVNPAGMGLAFVVLAVGSYGYTGTTSPLSLP